MRKFDKSSKIVLILVSGLMLGGCFNDSGSVQYVIGDPSDIVDDNESTIVECNSSIPESGIHFDITGVDYSAVTVVDMDESNATLTGARQLAAQCAQCHGTYGVAVGDTVENWPSLWGTGRNIAKTMKDYNDTAYEYSAMHIHSSMTYTQDQIKLIQKYYENVTYTGGE